MLRACPEGEVMNRLDQPVRGCIRGDARILRRDQRDTGFAVPSKGPQVPIEAFRKTAGRPGRLRRFVSPASGCSEGHAAGEFAPDDRRLHRHRRGKGVD